MISRKISEALKVRNMSQKELAEKAGITEATISRYANGSRIPRGTEVVKIAKALNCSCDFLVGLSDDIECNHFKPMTNADRIRSMSNEELAEFLHNTCDFINEEDNEPYKSMWLCYKENEVHDSVGDLLEWLQQESVNA